VLSPTDLARLTPTGLVSRLENRIDTLDSTAHQLDSTLQNTHKQLGQAEQMLGAPFPRADALTQARRNVTRLEELLAPSSSPTHRPPNPLPHHQATPPG
jgi:multidrug resistance efflux pump